MGGINFGWLAVWGSELAVWVPSWLSGFRAGCLGVRAGCLGSEPRLAKSQTGGMRTFVRRLGEATALGGVKCGQCPDFASYTLAFAVQLRQNHGKTSVRVNNHVQFTPV